MAGGDTSQKEETWDDFFRQREQNSCSPEPQVLDQLGGAEDATTLPFKSRV
jgi:hypothetical protein